MTDKPTDEALENLFVEETGFDIDDFPAAIFGFARAVLAKWGSPVVAGEPKRVFIVATGEEHNGEATYTRYDASPPPLCDSECLYTTSQPTQAQAGTVPLTDEQCDAIYDALDLFGRGVDVYEFGLPMSAGDGETPAKEVARGLIREAAHGIAPPPTA